jgi:hypothetical protein
MNMQAKWRRVFAVAFAVLIGAAAFALLEAGVLVFWFWKSWGFGGGNDSAGVVALAWGFFALPAIFGAAMIIGLVAYVKLMPDNRG